MADTPTAFNLLSDGADDFLGGQDASKIPDRIPSNCYYTGVNVSVRRGSIQPRWGFERLGVTFSAGTLKGPYATERTYKDVFESGKFQTIVSYFVGQYEYIIIVVAGVIFVFDPVNNVISHIPISDGSFLNSRVSRINHSAAGRYLVLYDFPSFPVIIDGLSARRANPAAMEVPASILGAYNQNRLFVANAGSEFTGGDPTGSLASGINPPITFAEVMTIGSQYYGQLFQLPTAGHSEQITYMGFLQMADTSTGIGPMIVGSSKAIYTYNTQNPRATWVSATSNTPFGSLFCYDAGIVGPRAFANVNSDAFFLAADGYVRSLSMSRSQQSTWARVPLSREVENWFKYWDKSLINLSFVSYFRNKVFFSVNPYRQAATDYDSLFPISDYAFGGLVVMELDSLTAFGQASKPVWAGLWTGIRPMDMVTIGDGGDRAFVIAKDEGINRLYEIDPDITYDTADNKVRLVRSRIYTKEYDFKDPFQNKEIHSINFNFDTLQGDFTLDLKYKPSHSACFSPWKTFNFYAPWRTFDIPDSCLLDGFAGQHIRDFTFGAPNEDLCSPVTSDFFKVFRKIQLEITITAKYWEIHEIKVNAMPRPLSPLQTICDPFPKVSVCECKTDDWDIFPFEDCTKLIT